MVEEKNKNSKSILSEMRRKREEDQEKQRKKQFSFIDYIAYGIVSSLMWQTHTHTHSNRSTKVANQPVRVTPSKRADIHNG